MRLVLDNVLDGGTGSAQSGDRLRVLARAAVTTFTRHCRRCEAAAKDIGDLNGDTARKGNQFPADRCLLSLLVV